MVAEEIAKEIALCRCIRVSSDVFRPFTCNNNEFYFHYLGTLI